MLDIIQLFYVIFIICSCILLFLICLKAVIKDCIKEIRSDKNNKHNKHICVISTFLLIFCMVLTLGYISFFFIFKLFGPSMLYPYFGFLLLPLFCYIASIFRKEGII